MAKKVVPGTHLMQCKHCDLILRFDDSEFDDLSVLPNFCHLIPNDDLEQRRETCPKPKFKKPKGI